MLHLSQVPLSAISPTEPTFEEWLDFAAKPHAGKRKCVKATAFPCGNTCLPSHTKSGKPTNCKKTLTGQAKSHAGWLKMQAENNNTSGGTKKSPKVNDSGNTKTTKFNNNYKPVPPKSRNDEEHERRTDEWLKERGYVNQKGTEKHRLYEHDKTHLLLHDMIGFDSKYMAQPALHDPSGQKDDPKGIGPSMAEEICQRALMALAFKPNATADEVRDFLPKLTHEDSSDVTGWKEKNAFYDEVAKRMFSHPNKSEYIKKANQYALNNVKVIGEAYGIK